MVFLKQSLTDFYHESRLCRLFFNKNTMDFYDLIIVKKYHFASSLYASIFCLIKESETEKSFSSETVENCFSSSKTVIITFFHCSFQEYNHLLKLYFHELFLWLRTFSLPPKKNINQNSKFVIMNCLPKRHYSRCSSSKFLISPVKIS